LNEVKLANQELAKQNQLKTEEIKLLIERMEQYKKHKDIESAKLKT